MLNMLKKTNNAITPKVINLPLFFKFKDKYENPFISNFYYDMTDSIVMGLAKTLELIINDEELNGYIFKNKPFITNNALSKLVDTVYTNTTDVFANDYNLQTEFKNVLKDLSKVFENNITSKDHWEVYILKVINLYNQSTLKLFDKCRSLNDDYKHYNDVLVYLLGQLTNREIIESVVG